MVVEDRPESVGDQEVWVTGPPASLLVPMALP